MPVVLKRAQEQDVPRLWQMQVEAFLPMLKKYGDYSTNPACEDESMVRNRFRQPHTDYYLILSDGEAVGGVRVVRREDGKKRISPLFVLPAHQGKGIAQSAMKQLEALYPGAKWELNTILEEKGNCHLYEKMGFCRTGEYEKINDKMTLVYYRKYR